MKHLPIRTFRRLTLALVAAIFTGFVFSSVASAEDFEILRSKYRIEVTGLYENQWQGQTSGYPSSATPWSQETGSVTAGFRTARPWIFHGSKFKGDLPGTTRLPKFQFFPGRATITRSNNRAKLKRKINYVPFCGGELGPCDGTEKSGVETTNRSCRKEGRIPIDLSYDADGFRSLIEVGLGFHQSMNEFCGEKYPGENSIQQLKQPFRMKGGLDDIANLKKGEKFVRQGSQERGWIGGDGHPDGARNVKQCPQMSGVGSRQCWTTAIRIEVTRVR